MNMDDVNFEELSNEDLETAAGGCRPRCGGCWGGGFGTGPVVINTPGAIPGYPGAIPVGGPVGGIPGFPGGGYGAYPCGYGMRLGTAI